MQEAVYYISAFCNNANILECTLVHLITRFAVIKFTMTMLRNENKSMYVSNLSSISNKQTEI